MGSDQWTDEQKAGIFEAAWKDEEVLCPADQAVMKTTLHIMAGRKNYTLAASCPRCGAFLEMRSQDDPKARELREWAEDEKRKLVDDHYGGRPVTCPVDGAKIEPDVRAMLGVAEEQVTFRCHRCGQKHEHRPAQ